MLPLRRTIDLLIYASVIFGVVLLLQLYYLVPTWLFSSVFVGWIAYVVVAALAAKGRSVAYPLALALAILTLLVSLPQPQHYSYGQAGLSLAAGTFIIGSALQLVLIILIPIYLRRTRARRH